MSKEEETKTTQIRAMVSEAEETGLIEEESIAALRVENLQIQERIAYQRKLQAENLISKEVMEERIKAIEQEIKDKVTALGLDMSILIDEDLSSLKSALRHNAQTSVHSVRLFLRGKTSMLLEDGKLATLDVFTNEEIQKLLGESPERFKSLIAAAKRPQYDGPLKKLLPEDLQRLEKLANSDWRIPRNINELLYALVTTFNKCFKGNIIQKIYEFSEIINGRKEKFVGEICKSTNRATPEQITAYCEENRREFMDWIHKYIDEETNQTPARLNFLRELLEIVASCDYSNPEALDSIYTRINT